jgi:DNA-binding NarL/FixJ family response regulator
MLESLIAVLAGRLDVAGSSLDGAAELLREWMEVDRVSISEIDEAEGRFEIVASSGASLLVSGTRLPLDTSSHFRTTAERRVFEAPSFERLRDFVRPLDEVVVAAGFASGCAVPIIRGERVVGAVSLSSREAEVDYAPKLGVLTAVSGMLALAIGREPPPPGPAVLVCHDDPLVGQGIAKLVERSADSATLVCSTIDEAIGVIGDTAPDLIVCDDYVGGERVDAFAPRLRRAGASAPLLVVATHDTAENLSATVRAGAAAFIPRAEAAEALPLAMSTLRSGRTLLPPDAGVALDGGERLTTRERDVVVCLEEGLRMKQIALRFAISEATVKCHARNVFRKLNASSRAEAVREARRQGLLV